MASEKKILHVGYRMEESMVLRIKGLAEAKGITESEFVRMACSEVIDREMAYLNSLNAIFTGIEPDGNKKRVNPRTTPAAPPKKTKVIR